MTAFKGPRDFRNLKQWLPPTSLDGLKQEINELFEDFFQETLPAWRGEGPRVDVTETPNSIEVTADLPGWQPEQVDVDVGENYLTITGQHAEETKSEVDDRRFHRAERRSGNFSRSVWLPCPVNPEQVDAQLASGVLTIKIPKKESAQRRQIKIKPAGPASPPPQEAG